MNNDDGAMDRLVDSGIRFLESLTNYYGTDKGMEVWEAIGTAAGNEVKGKVFFALITGRRSGKVGMQAGNAKALNQTIPVIKCIRTYPHSGLKEAKDLWDESNLKTVFITVEPEQQASFERELRSYGCIIS